MRLLLLLLPLVQLKIQTSYAENSNEPFNLTHYRNLPSMFQLDDYDLCMQQPPSRLVSKNTYCVVYAEIVPNASSTLWQQIEQASKIPKFQYRHDKIFFGVCLESCKRSIHTLSKFQRQQLYEGEVLDTELKEYYNNIYKRSSDEHLHYGHTINSCLNREFLNKYQLRLRTHIEYCDRANEELPHDALDTSLYVLVAVFLLLTILSTFYDGYLKVLNHKLSKDSSKNFYKHDLKTPGQRWLTSFSVARNYYRLVLPTKGALAKDLRFFDSFRVLTVLCVIAAHVLMLYMFIQIRNPEFFEQSLPKIDSAIFQNGHVVIQIYFVMTSFLIYVKFMEKQLINKDTKITTCIAVYFRVFILRYLRLLPSLLLLILGNATFLTRLSEGPLWRHVTEAERVNCREHWWKNVLFINNFFIKDICSLPTWYLGADMQLFEFYLIIIIVVMKYPQLKKTIYTLLILLAIGIPACITYFLKLGPVYHLEPEMYRYLFYRNAKTYLNTYPMFYTNLGGYLMGFVCAEIYLKMGSSRNVTKLKSQWHISVLFWLLTPVALLILFSGYIFIKNDYEPSIWMAIYAGLYKNLWILVCGGFILCYLFKEYKLFYDFCCLPFFRPLSRISFQTYLWHLLVVRYVGGYFRDPVYLTRFHMLGTALVVLIISQLLAFIVALLFEYPLAELLKYATTKKTVGIKLDTKMNTKVRNSVEFTAR